MCLHISFSRHFMVEREQCLLLTKTIKSRNFRNVTPIFKFRKTVAKRSHFFLATSKAVPESVNLRFQTYHNITKRTSTNRTYPPYIPLFQWYFLKSNFSVRSCGATNLKTSADWLVFLWWNLMYDVWRPVVCGVQYDDVMTSFIKTIKTQAEKRNLWALLLKPEFFFPCTL